MEDEQTAMINYKPLYVIERLPTLFCLPDHLPKMPHTDFIPILLNTRKYCIVLQILQATFSVVSNRNE